MFCYLLVVGDVVRRDRAMSQPQDVVCKALFGCCQLRVSSSAALAAEMLLFSSFNRANVLLAQFLIASLETYLILLEQVGYSNCLLGPFWLLSNSEFTPFKLKMVLKFARAEDLYPFMLLAAPIRLTSMETITLEETFLGGTLRCSVLLIWPLHLLQ